MRTVTENTAILDTSFDMSGIHVVGKEEDYHDQRSCFYEFGVDHNEFIEDLWKNQDDSTVADINRFFS